MRGLDPSGQGDSPLAPGSAPPSLPHPQPHLSHRHQSPRRISPIILIRARRFLPPGDMDIQKGPIVRLARRKHFVQHRRGAHLDRQIRGLRSQVGLQPLCQAHGPCQLQLQVFNAKGV